MPLKYYYLLLMPCFFLYTQQSISGPAGYYGNKINPLGISVKESSILKQVPKKTEASKTLSIKFAATADVHGHVSAWDFIKASPTEAGLSRLVTLMRQLRAGKDPSILIEAGDFLQGSPFNSVHHDLYSYLPNPSISAMNIAQYDIVVPGNHEFDFGREYLENSRFFSSSTWLATNLYVKGDQTPYDKFRIFDFYNNRVRIGVIGFTAPGTPKWAAKENVSDYDFEDILKSATRIIPGLKERHNLQMIVSVIHAGRGPGKDHPLFKNDSVILDNIGYKLSSRFPQIDLVIMSHTHRSVLEKMPHGAMLIEPAAYSKQLALVKADFKFIDDSWGLFSVQGELVNNSKDIPEDKAIKASISARVEKFKKALSEKIGVLKRDHEETFSFSKDSPALDFIHTVQMEKSGAQISVASPPFTFLSLKKGDLTLNQAMNFYGFENSLVKFRMTGSQIYELIEKTLTNIVKEKNGEYRLRCPSYLYLTFEGISIEVDLSRPAGKRVKSVKRKNRPLNKRKSYTLAVNSYTANGGAYPVFKKAQELWRSNMGIRNMVIDYIKKRFFIEFKANNNIKFIK